MVTALYVKPVAPSRLQIWQEKTSNLALYWEYTCYKKYYEMVSSLRITIRGSMINWWSEQGQSTGVLRSQKYQTDELCAKPLQIIFHFSAMENQKMVFRKSSEWTQAMSKLMQV